MAPFSLPKPYFGLLRCASSRREKALRRASQFLVAQITIGVRVYDVAVAATAQNSKEAIALRSPGSAVNARRPSSAAPMRAAIAMKPKIRGTIMGIGQGGVLFLTGCKVLIRW